MGVCAGGRCRSERRRFGTGGAAGWWSMRRHRHNIGAWHVRGSNCALTTPITKLDKTASGPQWGPPARLRIGLWTGLHASGPAEEKIRVPHHSERILRVGNHQNLTTHHYNYLQLTYVHTTPGLIYNLLNPYVPTTPQRTRENKNGDRPAIQTPEIKTPSTHPHSLV